MVFEAHREFVEKYIIEGGLQYNSAGRVSTSAAELERSLPDGWKLKRIRPDKRHFTVVDRRGDDVARISGTKLGQHPPVLDRLCRDKQLSKMVLQNADVPVPRGYTVNAAQRQLGHYLFAQMSKPVVIKPLNAAATQGVTINVSDEAAFEEAWDDAAAAALGNPYVMVEEQMGGFDLRAYVVGGECVAAATRMQPFLIGDGRSNVMTLLESERARRRVNAQLTAADIVVDSAFLELQGFTETSTLEAGEIVFLNTLPLVGKGAVSVEVTGKVAPALSRLAARAVNAFRGLDVAAVDLIVNSLSSPDGAKVLEINTRPALSMHTFPSLGMPVRPTDAVCQFYGWKS